jgi:hypothetical protein
MLKFSDGENFDTETELHIEKRKDGYYVVGNGMLIPCDDREDAKKTLEDMKGVK